MTKMPDTLALDARRATPDDASLTDSIGATSTPLDLAAQQAGTQTLLRGLAILEAIANGARDMRAIGAALGTTRSTTHRLVSSLVQARYLRQVQGGYLLGPKLIELGTIALEQMPLTAVARPHLEALAEATLDTIHLGVRDGDDVLYIDKIPGTRGLEMRSRVGHRMPLASTGIGKALLSAFVPTLELGDLAEVSITQFVLRLLANQKVRNRFYKIMQIAFDPLPDPDPVELTIPIEHIKLLSLTEVFDSLIKKSTPFFFQVLQLAQANQ